MEKRRRARINNSLNDLKNLVLESMKKDVSILSLLFTLYRTYLLRNNNKRLKISEFFKNLNIKK